MILALKERLHFSAGQVLLVESTLGFNEGALDIYIENNEWNRSNTGLVKPHLGMNLVAYSFRTESGRSGKRLFKTVPVWGKRSSKQLRSHGSVLS